MFTFLSYYHIDCLLQKCQVMFTLHVYDLTFILWDGGNGVGATAEKTVEPVAPFQDCTLTFVSVKPLNIFKETSGQFPAMVVASQKVMIMIFRFRLVLFYFVGDSSSVLRHPLPVFVLFPSFSFLQLFHLFISPVSIQVCVFLFSWCEFLLFL